MIPAAPCTNHFMLLHQNKQITFTKDLKTTAVSWRDAISEKIQEENHVITWAYANTSNRMCLRCQTKKKSWSELESIPKCKLLFLVHYWSLSKVSHEVFLTEMLTIHTNHSAELTSPCKRYTVTMSLKTYLDEHQGVSLMDNL